MSEKYETIGDVLESEKQMFFEAQKKYGDFFANAFDFNSLLNDFIKKVDPQAWIFIMFLAQIKKFHLLSLFSTVRQHHVQSMLNMRQVLESGVNAAYGLENPNQEDFVVSENGGTLQAPQALQNKRYTWLEDNYPDKSKHIKSMKTSINNSCAHSSMIYAFNNFEMGNAEERVFETSFFDKDDDYLVKTDLWMIGNVAMGLMDLFNGINQKVKYIEFNDDFIPKLLDFEKKNHKLKAEMQKHPRYVAAFNRMKDID